MFEDPTVTARRALVLDVSSSGLAATESCTTKPFSGAAQTGKMAEWPMMAARTEPDTMPGPPAVSHGRCWSRAASPDPAGCARRSRRTCRART